MKNLSIRCELHSVLYDLCMSKEIYKHSNKLQEGGMYTQREIVNLVECINPQVDNDGHKLFSQITTMLSLESIERLVKIIKS